MSTMEVLKCDVDKAEVVSAASTASATTTISSIKGKTPPKPPEEFYKDLQQFHERRGTPIMHMPKISGCVVDLHRLYSEVTEHGGFLKVNLRDEWEEILVGIGMRQKCVNATAAMKHIYRRCLEKYERLNFFGEDPDKVEALEAGDFLEVSGRSRARYPPMLHNSSGAVNSVPMSYNYRQHVVNMERRRMYRMSTDLHKASPYEKLMLSLISPLPNEQDFAINVCTLMANESKHTLKLNDYPKLLDVLLAHTGVFPDYTIRKLFQHVYTDCRRHSLYSFWRDLLHDKPQILEQYTDEQALRNSALIDELDDVEIAKNTAQLKECFASLDFLNLGRSEGTQEYIGQRVQQVVSILRNLSFFEENLSVFAKNRTFLRFLVMSANIRWGNIHNQALDIAGNVATELELLDPTTDDLSRSLMATLCDGIEGIDRAVIINSLEILYKLCQNDKNEDHIHKCLNLKFYETVCLFLSLNDIMLLIFTLEAIYALTSMGARSCHLIMQVRGVVDQLVSLITVEAQSYGPDGCILMRVVETVPGNMLPMVAQNIANLQNVAVLQKQQNRTEQQKQHANASLPTQQSQQQLLHHPHNQLEQQQATNVADNLQNQQQQQQHQQLQQNQQTQQPTQQQQPAQPQAPPLQIPQSCTHDDEQYALAWLSATFEQAGSAESRVEQQELYRMYLVHCQKSGKHSVVNNLQFPRLVRLIFNNSVGPVIVRCTDGTELPGLHYVAIRVRAQPLPIQGKSAQLPQKTGDFSVARKAKKKTKPQQEQQQYSAEAKDGIPSSNVSLQAQDQQMEEGNTETVGHECGKSELKQTPALIAKAAAQDPAVMEEHSAIEILADVKISHAKEICKATAHSAVGVVTQQQQPVAPVAVAVSETTPQQLALQQQPSSSVIKSLLANKVTQRQQKQKDLTAATTSIQGSPHSSSLITSNVNVLPTQMQQQTQPQLPPQTQPIKVTSTAISALVNNPLMQNTPVKVGQTTIKPLNPQLNFEKKAIADSAPPPLAPLSGGNVAKDACGRPVIIANQMLVEMLDKKTVDPPIPATIVKRKIEDNSSDPSKRLALDARKEEGQVTSKNAANLYAEFAASLLEDEELDEMPSLPAQPSMLSEQKQPHAPQQSILLPTKLQQTAMPASSSTMQRQLLFQTNQPTAMATIKTDQGLQTVPVILQQKSLDSTQPQLIQQVLQQGGAALAQVPQQTQYVLATNPQGQTYLVAQQTQPPAPPPSSTQTVLVTQTPQQQSAGTKTIIILQQQQQQILGSGPGGQQKMIMTTPQGQQVLVTQRTQPAMSGQTHQQQFFINQQTGATTQIQHVPVSSAQPVAAAANLLQRQLLPTTQHPQTQTTSQQQPQTGQISPSLLSQLNHIPATIKLHQPGQQLTSTVTQPAQPHQQATISRLGKSVSIVQTVPALPQIPQLQQHQSIIQQHIISGPSEKRQVVLSGRTIEIKETVITQAHPPPQQSQLNSQTIITKQPPQQLAPAMGVQQQTQQQQQQAQQQQQQMQQQQQQMQQQQQQMQQQPANSSIIQKNIMVPQPGPAPQQQPTFGQKIVVEQTNLAQSKAMPQAQAMVQTILPHSVATQASIMTTTTTTPSSTIKKPTIQAKQQQLATTVAAVVNSITSAVGPPPLTASTTAVTTTTTAQQQQLQQHPENRTESKPSGGPTLHSTAFTTPVSTTTTAAAAAATIVTPSQQLPAVEANWLYICDWRNCPRRKFKSISDLQHHACSAHSPDHLDPAAEIFCQWGPGPGLCDGIPRKRYSLMTHIIDRHITVDSLRSAVQRRIATGTTNVQPTQPPVTIVRNVDQSQRGNTASPALSTSSSSSLPSTGSSAIHAIKRHTADFVNPKELMDENEGPVTKSIRLTAALILRNLVTYTTTAKRSLRRYEPHLANVALSNVESSGAISHILYELNN